LSKFFLTLLPGTLAELYVQKIEKDHIKQWLDSNEISYYKRYVDDIIIIYNTDRINEERILLAINNIEENLTFKLTPENNNTINFLDLTISRKQNNLELGIYRKNMNTDTTIHNISNHPMEQKTTAFRYYINRLISLPLAQKEKSKDWTNIFNMAKNNGSSTEQIIKIKKQLSQKSKEKTHSNKTKTWATFTYYGGFMRSITNIFKNSTIKTAYKTTNNIFNLLASEKQTSGK